MIFPVGHFIMTPHFRKNVNPLLIRTPLKLSTKEYCYRFVSPLDCIYVCVFIDCIEKLGLKTLRNNGSHSRKTQQDLISKQLRHNTNQLSINSMPYFNLFTMIFNLYQGNTAYLSCFVLGSRSDEFVIW